MSFDFSCVSLQYDNSDEEKAAAVFKEEALKRGISVSEGIGIGKIIFIIEEKSKDESFKIIHNNNLIKIYAHRLRGLIYGMGIFFRNCHSESGQVVLVKNITCDKSPFMKIRGHQLSYTDMNNTCETWDKNMFRQYIKELMFFGTNIIEAVSTKNEPRTKLMKYTYQEALKITSEICCELDIDFSVWHPVSSEYTDNETLESLNEFYDDIPKFNVLFPPGGDPGDLQAEDFLKRVTAMKKNLLKKYPELELWPSAQAPHEYSDWGERFLKTMLKLPKEIDGIIYGPNHPVSLDELRRKTDLRYPIRLYPDIAHNVRCEIPVHFNRDDWHYSLAATLNRESVNPRPCEYALYHKKTMQYVCGSVTYSEGVNDDLNKFVWSALDFDANADLREILRDYSRLFFPTADCESITDALFGLEQNWNGDPALNSSINPTAAAFTDLKIKHPELMRNWRFVLFLFRAQCDRLVRMRRIFELDLINKASLFIGNNNIPKAKEILEADFTEEYKALRKSIDSLGEKLFRLIGIQLDVEHYGGKNPERGCTLMTVDNPVTDRNYLLNKAQKDPEHLKEILRRNIVAHDEYYFSFAEDGFDVCGMQEGDYYMNFLEASNYKSEMPLCISKVYDHFNFRCKIAGLTGGSYKLRITYMDSNYNSDHTINHFRIALNGKILYEGKLYGGRRDFEFEKKFLPEGFICICYDADSSYFCNGCTEMEITEPVKGFKISEFRFTKS